tara:strand:+ start:263 stop:598 length:336 start_codon:yes stop_codon:yes gene_type:complete
MLTKKEKKKLYLKGYKHGHPKRKSQDEIDLETVAKIKKYAVNGKIAILRIDQFFYDSPDFVVEGYEDHRVTLIPAHYTAWRYHQKEEERFSDAPYSLKIIDQKKEGAACHC